MADGIDIPANVEASGRAQAEGAGWGSDVVARTVRALGYEYMALVPGASFRGLHDSLVNHLGNRQPQMVVCLHEGIAVSIADGYAKVTEKPMLVGLHANVGLMNGSMGIFNAWCDRSPMVVIGATGPVDAHSRRPWIDWVHTARDQGALVRNYVKWDDQPASAEAAVESVLRAHQISTTAPYGPTYVCLDVALQEGRVEREVSVPDVHRFAAPHLPSASHEAVASVVDALAAAQFPVLMMGRVSRGSDAWNTRIALAEAIGAPVLTSIHNPAAFPTTHPLHLLPVCGEKMAPAEKELLAKADLVISLDWLDLAGYLRAAFGPAQSQEPVTAKVIHASLDGLLTNGWSMDHQALAAIDIPILSHPDTFATELLAQLRQSDARPQRPWQSDVASIRHWTETVREPDAPAEEEPMTLAHAAAGVASFCSRHSVTVARLPIGWPSQACRFEDPLAYLGKDGGAAIGTGPAHTVGAALALQGESDRLVLGVVGDGDYLMGVQALWTASRMRLPMMLVVTNNRSYFNDERHQETVARERGRPVENKWIGQALDDPAPDLVMMARAQGFSGIGVRTPGEFAMALEEGRRVVAAGGRFLIDCRIAGGYVDATHTLDESPAPA